MMDPKTRQAFDAVRDALLAAEESLLRCGCQLGFCDGPTLEPEDMVTCHRCAALAKVRHALGKPIRRAGS